MNRATLWRQRLRDEAIRARAARDYGKALAAFEVLCQLEPEEAVHPHRAAEMHARLGAPGAAAAEFLRAARLYAQGGFAARALAVLRLARSLAGETVELDALRAQCERQRADERARAADRLRAAERYGLVLYPAAAVPLPGLLDD